MSNWIIIASLIKLKTYRFNVAKLDTNKTEAIVTQRFFQHWPLGYGPIATVIQHPKQTRPHTYTMFAVQTDITYDSDDCNT